MVKLAKAVAKPKVKVKRSGKAKPATAVRLNIGTNGAFLVVDPIPLPLHRSFRDALATVRYLFDLITSMRDELESKRKISW